MQIWLGKSAGRCYRQPIVCNITRNESAHMAYTLGEAAKVTGMSKAALSRAIKRGTISAEKQPNGSFKIEPSELHREYPVAAEQQDNAPPDATKLHTQNIELRAKLEAAAQRLIDKDGVIDDLRRRLDTEGEERRRLTAILTDQRAKAPDVMITPPPETTAPAAVEPPPTPQRKGWRRLFG